MIAFYLDPGTGSALISSIIALVAVGFYMLKGFIYRKFNIGSSSKVKLDPSVEYGLVFYSEGKQYWNTFKPLVEELTKRGIELTYFSSDEEDPGLSFASGQYIGNNRETYYFLSNLKAQIVVMTTPGLDVLQIKRSKDVQHYCHVTHSAGGAEYKAYGMDYYDSILVGGTGDKEWVRALEEARGDKPKIIEEIGCTYLDVMRESLQDTEESWFEEDKPVVLVSPSWGTHGLLSKYGKEVLQSLSTSGYNIIVRPHPQSFIAEAPLMEDLQTMFPDSSTLRWDRRSSGLAAMGQADIMVSDFSGIIFDFLFLFKKPILTFKGIFDKRGRDSMDVDREPWNLEILNRIGKTLSEEDVPHLSEIIDTTLQNPASFEDSLEEAQVGMDRYPNESGVRGADFVERTLGTISKAEKPIGVSLPAQREPQGIRSKLRSVAKTLFDPSLSLEMFFAILLFHGYVLSSLKLFPEGSENYYFAESLLPFFQPFLLIFLGLSVALAWVRGKGHLKLIRNAESIKLQDMFIVLFPMASVFQYVLANQDILYLKDSLFILAYFLIVSIGLFIVIPWIFSVLSRKLFTVTLSCSYWFIVIAMASLFGRFGHRTRLWYLLFAFIYGCLFLVLMFKPNVLKLLAILYFLVVVGSSFFALKSATNTGSESTVRVPPSISSHFNLIDPPDIYLLVYDSYANDETLEYYGIDNSDISDYLLNSGFAIYDGIYSIAGSSVESMARVLNISEFSRFGNTRRVIAQGGIGTNLLKTAGYEINSIFTDDYLVRGTLISTDFYNTFFPNPQDPELIIAGYKILIGAIWEGVFRFDAEFSNIDRDDFLIAKRSFLKEDTSNPRFLYSHSNYPDHTPNTGVLRDNETELYHERLLIANEEMKGDIETILEFNPSAIVIVAADHGPYLTKNGTVLSPTQYPINTIDRYDVQDRFGTMLAIRWPDPALATRYDISILQDSLAAVLAYVSGEDEVFSQLQSKRKVLYPNITGGVSVEDGIVIGGADDGKPLFDRVGVRFITQDKAISE